MNVSPALIQRISQKDNFVFTIEWNDGLTHDFRLSEIQKQCPCARCVDELTGKRILKEGEVSDNVSAISIKSVGKYALQIHFTSGCSLGIYSFDFLRQMKNLNE